ncbi:MAG: DeoR/GlpR transcriptional regulator [Oceanospirillaceae bacterium]|nr:DeoR/GlpR transcriptional regulator [Oceanospirillaceae bacterium]
MSTNHRQEKIVQWVNSQGRQNLFDLANKFSVSVQTVRSDIRALAEQGLLLRSHGEAIPFPDRENISYNQRIIKNIKGKILIAKLCASQISDYQSLFLGSGSSVAQLSKLLHGFSGLQVMTTNLHVAHNISESSDVKLTVAGGRLRLRDKDIIGGDALQFFLKYRADIGIVSVGALDKQGNLYDYNDDEIMSRQALLSYCRYKILLVDSCKFDKEARCCSGHLTDFDCIISDKKLPLKLYNQLIAAQIIVIHDESSMKNMQQSLS